VKALLETYASRIYLFARRLTARRDEAEDLTQEVFVQALRKQSSLRDPTAARAWLFTITVNLWRSGLRRRDREERYVQQTAQRGPRYAPAPEQAMIGQEEVRQVRAALDALPKRQQEVLHLHAFEAFTLPEIAAILHISPAAAKASLSLARQRMREQLRELAATQSPHSCRGESRP
jgi:RNA polymerase sigma-70 factor, ECF subfamily